MVDEKNSDEVKESILNLINTFWPITAADIMEKMGDESLTEMDVLSSLTKLKDEEKIEFKEDGDSVLAWPIEVNLFINGNKRE
jgi:hypothetical protein